MQRATYGIDEHGVAGTERDTIGESVTQLDVEFGHARRFLGETAGVDHTVEWHQRRQRHQHFLLVTIDVDRIHQTICVIKSETVLRS